MTFIHKTSLPALVTRSPLFSRISVSEQEAVKQTVKVLRDLPNSQILSGYYLKQLALVMARPGIKPGAVFLFYNNAFEFEILKRITLPVPFAIEKAVLSSRRDKDSERSFVKAKPLSPTSYSIFIDSENQLELPVELSDDVNPYWVEKHRNIGKGDLYKFGDLDEITLYIGADEYSLDSLLNARKISGKSGDLARAAALGIPEKAAEEFSSLKGWEQEEEYEKVIQAINKGYLPRSLLLAEGAWWWTTMNVLNSDRREELEIADKASSFYRQLEKASTAELQRRFNEN